MLDGVELMGDGTVADMLWARPSATVLGIDVPPVIGSSSAVQAVGGRAHQPADPERASTAATPRTRWSPTSRRACRGACSCTIERVAVGDPFVGSLDGPGVRGDEGGDGGGASGAPMTTEGQGGSIPLCNVLADTYPDAEIMLMGVEEPKCLIHAPNESVDPSEIEHLALAEALFLEKYAEAATMTAPAFTTDDFAQRLERAATQAAERRADRPARDARPGPSVLHRLRADRDHRADHDARRPARPASRR